METKIITKNWDRIDPGSIESYQKDGGYQALEKALLISPKKVIKEIKKSRLQGRGGAGFSTGQKWEITDNQKSKKRYFICNLDESEPGTFKDKAIAENNPHNLIEGVAVGAYAIQAQKAFIYLNGNFSMAEHFLQEAIRQAKEKNFLGKDILGSKFSLEIKLIVGAGAYICGEETALINSIEGNRGEPKRKPPYTCEKGLFCKPTVVNNAETIANIPWIIENGAEEFLRIGTKDSPGTKLFCIDGAVKNPGLYEAPLGIGIGDLIIEKAGGIADGKDFWFAQIGGSSGRLAIEKDMTEKLSYNRENKIPLGSGSILVIDSMQDIKKLMLSWMRFFERESCGQCVPCREGTFRLLSILERLDNGNFNDNDREDFHKLVWTLDNTTFCALGKFAATALKDVVKHKFVPELKD